MVSRRLFLLIMLCGLLLAGAILPAGAQDQAVLSLAMDTTALETGQTYEVTIRLDNVTNLWATYLEIAYDPALVYIIGTKSGSPVTAGELFDSNTSLVVFNGVDDNLITFAPSRLRPAEPIDGGGIIGTFRIYPLQAGNTPILFSKADLVQPNSELLTFTPVLIDLTITGDPVEPPTEATATPTLTPTVTETIVVRPDNATPEPTLINVTLDPNAMAPTVETKESGTSPLLIIAIIIMAISGIAALSLVVMGIRRRR